MHTPDLLDALASIASDAKTARERIANGTMPKGTSTLQRIEHEARDAIARATGRSPAEVLAHIKGVSNGS